MRSRGLVVVLALILATLATAGVFLYARGVKEDAKTGGTLVTVIVSKVDVPTNTFLNDLISNGDFTTLEVPKDAVINDAVTSVDELRNKRNSVPIFAHEQIPISRLQGGGEVPGGILGIPDGYQAITISLAAPRAVGSSMVAGDNVTIYATFSDVDSSQLKKGGTTTTTTEKTTFSVDETVVLVPEAQILRVVRPNTTEGSFGQQTQQDLEGNVSVTLALLPEDAQKFVFALEQGAIWLSLLPPDQKGVPEKPVSYAQVLK
jgi:pilus assembly protein CpaB